MRIIDHLHPAIVHFPIALLLLASAAGLLHLFWQPRPELRVLTWSTMLPGWIGGAAAVLSGLLAQSGLPPQTDYTSVLNLHIGAGLAAQLIYGIALYRWWIGRNRKSRAKTGAQQDLLDMPSQRWLLTLLLLSGAALVCLTGWNGGQLVYIWGVNVGG